MDKRYQVFVSSTFLDLVEERRQVIQALLELDCFPAGMELFNASDKDQWSLIKNVIDTSDYYIVIIGGRYGSVTDEGISYTEKEFDYALSINIPILAFLHQYPGEIPQKNIDMNPDAKIRLEEFRAKLQTGRVVKYFSSPEDLGGKVSRSLIMEIKNNPMEGWVRGRYATNTDVYITLNKLRDEKEKLQTRLSSFESIALEKNFASGQDQLTLFGTLEYGPDKVVEDWEMVLSWDDIFAFLGPVLYENANDQKMLIQLSGVLKRKYSKYPQKDIYGFRLSNETLQTIIIQFLALGLITVSDQSINLDIREGGIWTLTPFGKEKLKKLRAIRKGEVNKEVEELKKKAIKKHTH